ncbi:MAG: hypothetical protein OK441_05725 [Thaumarchaeota archaeon]|nr:hypothetical protein [Nitrososphaerota archaeon]
MARYKLTKENYILDLTTGRNVAFLLKRNDEWSAHGFFGECYASADDRMKCARAAVVNPRLGKIPAGAAK